MTGFLDSGGGDGWDLLSPDQQVLLEEAWREESTPTPVAPATDTTGAGA